MALTSGTKLGPYEIVAPLGAGGMGEVYRARDSRLGREVAIKVLPTSFCRDLDRLRRFEQEARAAILKEEPPDLLAAGQNVPAALDRIVRHCLEKNPEERFQSARDLAFHLGSTSSVSESTAPVLAPAQEKRAVRAVGLLLALLALAVAGGGAWWFRGSRQSGPKSVKF